MDHRGEGARVSPPARLKRKLVAVPLFAILTLLAALTLGAAPQLMQDGPAVSAPVTISTTAQPTTARPSTAHEFIKQPSATTTVTPSPAAVSSVSPSLELPAPKSEENAEGSAPRWITIDGASIDMAVLPLTPTEDDLAGQSLVPPLTMDAYWLTSYGTPGEGSANTTYITGHSWEDRDAPFNRLSSEARVGQTITVTTGTETLSYVIDSVVTHDKDTLRNSDIWDIVPNRLVLVSCYTQDLFGKNVVVTASPKP